MLGLGLALLAGPLPAKVGEVERLRGEVTLQGPGVAPYAVRQGEALDETQVLRTGADGEAVLRFVDNALLVLRPNSEVELARYRYQADDPSSATTLRLLRGGLRFVTGLVGKMNRDQVQVLTPVATIGVRGTDFDTVYRAERQGDLDAGSYTCVTEGGTYMRDERGQVLEILAGQTGFVTSADFVARGLAAATRFGLIQPPPGLFQAGTFDGQLQELKQEGLRRLQDKIDERLPSELRGMISGEVTGLIGGFLGLGKKDPPAETARCSG